MWELESCSARSPACTRVTLPAGSRRAGRADRHPGDPRVSRRGVTRARPRCWSRTPRTAPTRRPRRWPASGGQHPVGADGDMDLDALRAALGETAAVMITKPKTLGLFERRSARSPSRSTRRVGWSTWTARTSTRCSAGASPATGFDVMHINLHKTFSTPHGGGGPGAGRLAWARSSCRSCPRRASLARTTARTGSSGRRAPDPSGGYALPRQLRHARARYAYIAARRGRAARVSETPCSTPTTCRRDWRRRTHRSTAPACTSSLVGRSVKQRDGVRTLDIAKRLIDFGYHPPTIYFPLP